MTFETARKEIVATDLGQSITGFSMHLSNIAAYVEPSTYKNEWDVILRNRLTEKREIRTFGGKREAVKFAKDQIAADVA